MDLDWDWIKALPGKRVGELRIDDVLAGNDNLRIIFFVGNSELRYPLPMIWILTVRQKKRQEWTTAEIKTFKLLRRLVLERCESAIKSKLGIS